MKKILLLSFLILAVCVSSVAQLRYPVAGAYKRNAAQGMAIWGDNAYLLSNTGYCRVYNLKSETVIGEFPLGSTDEDNHANVASFGVEIPEGGEIPAIYVAECYGKNRCFVENIFSDRSQLVQTIRAFEHGEPIDFFDWVVDRDNGFLYGIRTFPGDIDNAGTKRHEVVKYRLPKLSEGSYVEFTEDDVLDRFTFTFANLTQGAVIRGRYLYMPTGLHQNESYKLNSNRAVYVIDLKKKEIKKSIDISKITVNEPEDMAFYGNKALLYCGQSGGLYQVKVK